MESESLEISQILGLSTSFELDDLGLEYLENISSRSLKPLTREKRKIAKCLLFHF